ncbi:MAG: hypothetical protein IVW57_16065 [Ktedonobacterales bacterium]|nr:hypothetical protein [Ktedonobacterales bacterium]
MPSARSARTVVLPRIPFRVSPTARSARFLPLPAPRAPRRTRTRRRRRIYAAFPDHTGHCLTAA